MLLFASFFIFPQRNQVRNIRQPMVVSQFDSWLLCRGSPRAATPARPGVVGYLDPPPLDLRFPEAEVRYSPAQCIGTRTEIITGRPEPEHISTSYVERQNLTMRMCMRRFTGLTNAFSKKIENHAAAIALHYFAYNFIKIHRTLRCTPAMAAGVTDRLWDVSELVALWEEDEHRQERAVA